MDFSNETPIYLQIINRLKSDIVTGKIKMGEKLMSTRELAVSLRVNPNTVQRVFKELENEGICFTKRGMGTYVTEDEATIALLKEQLANDLMMVFIDGMKKLNYSLVEIIEKVRSYGEVNK